jgi:DNA-3-methyladenine glycosylase
MVVRFSSCVLGLFVAMLDTSTYEIIPFCFYQRSDVVQIAKEMVGLYLFHETSDGLAGGRIVETEAYCGREDKACHAHKGRTRRTEVMFQSGGRAYIYLCYGLFHLFNVVTNEEDQADAVLIRAIEPVEGFELMRLRTGKKPSDSRLASGPGLVGKAMGFHSRQSGVLLGENIQLVRKMKVEPFEVECTARVGVDYAGEDALLPWRFVMKDNPYVSLKREKPNAKHPAFPYKA